MGLLARPQKELIKSWLARAEVQEKLALRLENSIEDDDEVTRRVLQGMADTFRLCAAELSHRL